MSLTSPFTAGTSLGISDQTVRFPQATPASANTVPYVGSIQVVTLTASQIASTLSTLNSIYTFYPGASNQFGITTSQATSLTNVKTLFGTLSAGAITFTVLQLQDIVVVSQMIRSWTSVNINPITSSTLVTLEGVLSSMNVVYSGSGYLNGTYKNINLTGGSGTGAAANINVTGGIILSSNTISTGTGYTSGTYTGVPLTGGSGTGAIATVTISGPTIIKTTSITNPGTGYAAGTYTAVALTGGSGTGAVGTVVITTTALYSTSIYSVGSAYTTGTYTNVPISGGSGTGATANIIVSSGMIVSATVNTGGVGYVITDTLTVANTYIGGTGTGFNMHVTSLISGVQTVTITNGGAGYLVGDNLSAPPSSLGGTGTGFIALVLTVTSGISSISITTGGAGYATTDILSALNSSLGGTGTGFTASVITTSDIITSVTIVRGGFGYKAGDNLSCLNTDINSPIGAGFVCSPATFSSTAIQTVSSAAFPNGATTIVCNDGYFICEQYGTGSWWVSSNQDGMNWNGLSTAVIESRSDNLVAVDSTSGGQIVLFGTKSMEFWYDAATSPFVYQRISGTQQDYGLAAKWSRAYVGNSIIFLGQNYQGQASIMQMPYGGSPSTISDYDINNIINKMTTVNDATAYAFTLDGHEFYAITFPTGNRTFLYDNTTDMWHEWQSGLADFNRHVTSLGYSYNYSCYAADCVNGNIYLIDSSNYTDNGSLIRREVDTIHICDDGNSFGIDEVVLDMDRGNAQPVSIYGDDNNPKISVQTSKDYGHTFGFPRSASLNYLGKFKQRVIWRRFGIARDIVFKFVQTSAVPFIINYAAGIMREGPQK